jgi:UDP-glucose 4-epimerase|tara:strand:- start:7906 stop:8781 length:876 start_codon:yes stop_codon:yes gene_type:complete
MKKNILIIGGSGFLGSHVSDEFSKKNYKVTIVDKKKSKYINKNQKFINLDLKNIKRLSEEIKKFDIIYYFADIADIQESKKNYMSTINQNLIILTEILKLIVNSKVKNFVYASSLYVFSEAGSFYRATKQCAEILIKEFSKVGNFSYKFVRYGSLYGERAQEWNGISKFISQIKVKGTVTYQGNGKEVRDYVHVKDAAKLSVKIIEDKIHENAVSILGQKSITVDQLFDLLFEISGKKKKVKYLNKINSDDHYGFSPYRYIPENSIKLTSNKSIDLGEGILRLFYSYDKKK